MSPKSFGSANELLTDLGIGQEPEPSQGGSKTKSLSYDELISEISEPVVKQPEQTLEAPVVEKSEVENYYTRMAADITGLFTPMHASHIARQGFGPQPEGGFDELMRPLDTEGEPYFKDDVREGQVQAQSQPNHDSLADAFTNTFMGIKGIAAQPMEGVRGAFDFMASIPGFGLGLVGAATRGSTELIHQIAGTGKKLNLEEVYNAASKGMHEGFEFFEPAKEVLGLGIDKKTRASALPGEVAMSIMNAASALGNEVAESPMFADSPNIRGAARFTGDIVGMMSMGLILHGKGKGRNTEFTKQAEEITVEAASVSREVSNLQNIPGALARSIEAKNLEIKKNRLENKAKRFADKFNDDLVVIEEMALQSEAIAKQRLRPVQETGLKKPRKARKPKKIEDPKSDLKSTTLEKEKPVSEITDVDVMTGVEIDRSKSPFNQSLEKARSLGKIFAERGRKALEDPEVELQKLINDVNRWKHGEEVPIEQVRDMLGRKAAETSELDRNFINPIDFVRYKERAKEASIWASEQTKLGTDVNQLNVMVPLDQVPKIVRNIVKGVKDAKELYRNKKVWKDTGFWLGRDGKWRYEINDSKSRMLIGPSELEVGSRHKLGNIFDHESLYKAAPELKNEPVLIVERGSIAGSYTPGEGFVLARSGKAAVKDTIIHEIQHYMNNKVGAFKGTSIEAENANVIAGRVERLIPKAKPKYREDIQSVADGLRESGDTRQYHSIVLPMLKGDPKTFGLSVNDIRNLEFPTGGRALYERKPGEIEARLASERMYHSKASAKKIPPWETLDSMLNIERIPQGVGTKLYSGLPDPKTLIKGAEKVGRYFDKLDKQERIDVKKAARTIRRGAVKGIVDIHGNVRKTFLEQFGDAGYRALQRLYLINGTSAKSAMMLDQMSKEVYGGANRKKKGLIDRYIMAERMKAIGRYKDESQFRPPDGTRLEEYVTYIDLFDRIEKLRPEEAADIARRSDIYYEWMKRPLKDALDRGLISESEYNDLVVHNYRRLGPIEKIFDNVNEIKIGKKTVKVHDSGVERLQRGRATDIYEKSGELMALETFNRLYGRIARNEAINELVNITKLDSNNPYVRVKSKDTKIPSGWVAIPYLKEGKKRNVHLHPEIAKEWITTSGDVSRIVGQVMKYLSGAPILRTFATGVNWSFAMAQLPMDIMHAWFAARTFEGGKWKNVYSPHAPIYAAQMGKDLATVTLDAALKKGRYEDYVNAGGGMNLLTHQGRLFQSGKRVKGPLDGFYKYAGKLNETTELMTRLSIQERVIKRRAKEKGISVEEARKDKVIADEAAFAARDYLDYAQGGSVAKVFNEGIPYLNASIQGTRGIARSLKNNTAVGIYKLSQLAALVTGLYIARHAMTPETAKDMEGNHDSQNNLLIPIGDEAGFLDGRGQKRYPYYKIPLDPSQRFFKAFFEAAMDKHMGKSVDVGHVVSMLKELSPVGLGSMPPSLSLFIGYVGNKDFWRNEDVWKGEPYSYQLPKWMTGENLGGSEEEIIHGKTPQFYQDIGRLTGLSPERMKFVVEELVTSGTVWSELTGLAYNMLRGMPEEQVNRNVWQILDDVPIAKRFVGITHPYSKHAEGLDKAAERDRIERHVQNSKMDMFIDKHVYEGGSKQDMIDYAKSFKDPEIFDRLMERYVFELAIKDISEKSLWRRMKGLSPRAKAEKFNEMLNEEGADKQKLWRELGVIEAAGGVISDSFFDEFGKIKGEVAQ